MKADIRATQRDNRKKALSIIEKAMTGFNERTARLLSDRSAEGERPIAHLFSHREGRYRLKLELLTLLSKDGNGEVPFDALPGNIRARYHLDVGICRFGLLHLQQARAAFDKGADDDEASPINRFESLMHRISVNIFLLDLDTAQAGLDQGLSRIGELPMADQARARIRLTVREANLARAIGGVNDLERAERLFKSVLDFKHLIPIVGDAAIACVDVFCDVYDAGLPGAEASLQRALLICETNASELGQQQFPHEVARFQIRRARIIARLGQLDAAEALLDSIAFSLARDGGSQRTLYEFQIAAADVLIRQGNTPWAYACYLHPCLRWTGELDYHLGASEVAGLAIKALDICDEIARSAPKEAGARIAAFRTALQKQETSAVWGGDAAQRSAILWGRLSRKSDKVDDPFYGFDLSALGRHLEVGASDLADDTKRDALRGQAMQRLRAKGAAKQDPL